MTQDYCTVSWIQSMKLLIWCTKSKKKLTRKYYWFPNSKVGSAKTRYKFLRTQQRTKTSVCYPRFGCYASWICFGTKLGVYIHCSRQCICLFYIEWMEIGRSNPSDLPLQIKFFYLGYLIVRTSFWFCLRASFSIWRFLRREFELAKKKKTYGKRMLNVDHELQSYEALKWYVSKSSWRDKSQKEETCGKPMLNVDHELQSSK